MLQHLRNAPARGWRGTTRAAAAATTTTTTPQGGRTHPRSDDGGETGENAIDLEGGGKRSGAEGWTKGHVAGYLGDMRAAGVPPDIETYQCAIRCATDAAVLDIMIASDVAAVEAAKSEVEGTE